MKRRSFLKQATLTSMGFMSLARCSMSGRNEQIDLTDLKLIPDPNGYLDLPEGFSYQIISKQGREMSDGFLVPGRPDGMGAFQNKDGLTVLVCNHENSPKPLENSPFGSQNERFPNIDKTMLYDAGYGKQPGLGGTTTLIYDEEKGELVEQYLSLVGTYRNCAGGVTPWGSWLTCEEDVTPANEKTVEKNHGYVFEVPSDHKGLVKPEPIPAMGRFNHEAVAVDPDTGIVYLTEDRNDGLIYRFIPNVKGQLKEGGRLQFLAIIDPDIKDTRNWNEKLIALDDKLPVRWVDIDDVDSANDDLRFRGAQISGAVFARGEGIWMSEDGWYMACTNGGPGQLGQVFHYQLSPHEGTPAEEEEPGLLKLFAESEDKSLLNMCDNLTIAPWGDVIICEDNGEKNHIRGINKEGIPYTFAYNSGSQSEFAGPVFSPSGKTLFVNIQESGDTIAIQGPWEKFNV